MEHVALLSTIFGVVVLWLTYRRKREIRRIEPSPLDVRITAELVRKEDCLLRHNESMSGLQVVRNELADMRAQRVVDAKDGAASREKMYQAIKDVRVELSSSQDQIRRDMSRGLQDIERSIGRLEGKISSKGSTT